METMRYSVARIRTNEETYPREEGSVVNKSGSDLARKLSPSLFTSFINIHFGGGKDEERRIGWRIGG